MCRLALWRLPMYQTVPPRRPAVRPQAELNLIPTPTPWSRTLRMHGGPSIYAAHNERGQGSCSRTPPVPSRRSYSPSRYRHLQPRVEVSASLGSRERRTYHARGCGPRLASFPSSADQMRDATPPARPTGSSSLPSATLTMTGCYSVHAHNSIPCIFYPETCARMTVACLAPPAQPRKRLEFARPCPSFVK